MTNCIVQDEVAAESLLIKLMMGIYGPLVAKDDLWHLMGYPSSTALRMAVCRKTSPVTVFSFPHRHNKFALSLEIAKWLLKQRLKNCAHPLQFVAEVPKALLRDYGVVLHERDIIEIMGVDNRDQLREYFLKDVLPFPIFTIDHRQTKLFALACEVPIHLSSL